MKVLIVEDEELSAERLQKLIRNIDPGIEVLATIPSVFETVAYLENNAAAQPDLIFMDIHLEDGNAFRLIEQENLLTPIIFTTAFDEYALRAFKANSIDYLLKPVNPLELQASISKFKKLFAETEHTLAPETGKYKERFLVTAGNRMFTFKTAEIAYFTIEERATFMRLFDGRHFAMEYSLERLSQMLDPAGFFRISRNLLLSIEAIREIHFISAGKLKIDLNPPAAQETYVSADRIAEFKHWLGR
jgi:DNA-binding LytR/AlgR family response regulator